MTEKLTGLNAEQVQQNREKYGANTLTRIPPDPFLKVLIRKFKEPMIVILLAALAIQMVLFLLGQTQWYEPAGVLIAVLIAGGVAAASDYSQENKASALRAEAEAGETQKVIRDGGLCVVPVSEIVVGDIVYLQAGDKIPADGEILDGAIRVDQAVLNGETEEAEKHSPPPGAEASYNVKDLLNEFYVYRGTVTADGEAYMEVRATGDRTLFGQLALEVQENTRATPLQVKLAKLAKQITVFGYVGATAIVIGILLKTVFTHQCPDGFYGWLRLIIDSVTVAVTVVVCAVPEGLPMLTSMLLSLQSIRMAKDNVLVRKINGLETAGSVSILYSDKTGTITMGRLTVAETVSGDLKSFAAPGDMPDTLRHAFLAAACVNNSASVDSAGKVVGGNSTDRALMSYFRAAGLDTQIGKENVVSSKSFDSNKKRSHAVLRENDILRAYIKGAPEKILEQCVSYMGGNGTVQPLTPERRNAIAAYMNAQSSRSMRLLAAACSDSGNDETSDMVLICLISIRDGVRKEAVNAINEVQNAGIQVVMVTGDRKETANAVAKEAGLLTDPEDVSLTSSELGAMSDDEVRKILPRLRVVARALPSDKSRLVRLAQDLNLVAGMTGDGVNDSPALKKADVGFAMGSGTEAAKEAGDITVLDDNFLSIEKAVLYGRTMFKSIRKFLIFQLTVNVAAVLVCFIGPMLGENTILTVTQLLLINLAMDTLAAAAYGGEPARQEYMREKPVPRSEGIITGEMFLHIIVIALYIAAATLAILFCPAVRDWFQLDLTGLKSALFATFMIAITLNGFNARTAHLNPLSGIGGNRNFLLIMLLILVLQFLFVTFGGVALSVERLSPLTWLRCFLLALPVLPIDMLLKLFRTPHR